MGVERSAYKKGPEGGNHHGTRTSGLPVSAFSCDFYCEDTPPTQEHEGNECPWMSTKQTPAARRHSAA